MGECVPNYAVNTFQQITELFQLIRGFPHTYYFCDYISYHAQPTLNIFVLI